jgi:4-hydroxy-tetrahydrodipicolinate synthase
VTTDLRGLWVPLITPFDERGDVDVPVLEALAFRLLDDGATGLVALGTTGEPATLTAAERALVVATCRDVCAARSAPLMVGAGTNSTATTLEEVARWNELAPDAAALLVVVPYYTRPSEAGIVAHLRVAAAASSAPVVAYNVPYRTGRGLGASALLELAEMPNVIGVKQAVGALDRDTVAVLAARRRGFHVLCGDDAYIAPMTLLGGSGAIAASAHLRTADFARLVSAALGADAVTAAALAHDLLPLVDAGFAEPSPAVWKAGLHALGLIGTPAVRPPLTGASSTATATLLAALASEADGEPFEPAEDGGGPAGRWRVGQA